MPNSSTSSRPSSDILAHGLACAFCDQCQHDFLTACSCRGRGICPGYNARRIVNTAADQLMPRLLVRQWVRSVPKRLRYYHHSDPAVQTLALYPFSFGRGDAA